MPERNPQRWYRLEGTKLVPCAPGEAGLLEWSRWMAHRLAEGLGHHVAVDQVGPLTVSTVFLGWDHRVFGVGPPLVFETMIIDGLDNAYERRTSTWQFALSAHQEAVATAKAQLAAAEALIGPNLP